jgi:AcrR family transcriptional regulator
VIQADPISSMTKAAIVALRRPRATPPPPPTRQRLTRAARESLLLKAAFEEFVAKGYAATRLEDVAARAHVAKGLVLFYFKRKEDLFRAVINDLAPPILAELDVLMAAAKGRPAADVLGDLLQVFYTRVVADRSVREVLRLLLSEGPRFPDLTEFYFRNVVSRAHAVIGQTIEAGCKRGEFRPLGPEASLVVQGPAALAMFWAMLFGNQHTINLDAMRKAHLDIVLQGLTKRRDAGSAGVKRAPKPRAPR